MVIILSPVNGIYHPMLEQKKRRKKGEFWPLVQIKKIKERWNIPEVW